MEAEAWFTDVLLGIQPVAENISSGLPCVWLMTRALGLVDLNAGSVGASEASRLSVHARPTPMYVYVGV